MITNKVLTLPRSIVLVGLMGAGKSSVGKILAQMLDVPFADSDKEVEDAAGCTITTIFATHGETAFRDCERRVIKRLLEEEPHIIALGGGAFINDETREIVQDTAFSIWIKADLDVLVKRTSNKTHRPLLLQGDPSEILGKLMEERHPIYALANLTVESGDGAKEEVAENILQELKQFLGQ